MILHEKIKSKVDDTIKYIFTVKEQLVEFSYIHKNDGKDIICVPTQTSCKLGCKFCFLTANDTPVINLTEPDIREGIFHIINDLDLPSVGATTLLISFMGSGEPLNNIKTVIDVARHSYWVPQRPYKTTRFAVATIMPSVKAMVEFTQLVDRHTKAPLSAEKLKIKLHLSLHSPFDDIRKDVMPAANNVEGSILLLKSYQVLTGNDVEIHYTLMDGVNDRQEDNDKLVELLAHRDIPIKFLAFKQRPDIDLRLAQNTEAFRQKLEAQGIRTEFYDPPGADIGSSCGQFLIQIKKPKEVVNEKTA